MSVTIPSVAELDKSARQFRKDILKMPVHALSETIQHMTPRFGIRYSQVVGEMSGSMQFGPYDADREDNSGITITPRELNTYLGSVVKNFDPNTVYQSIYGSAVTKGEALTQTDITRQIVEFLAAQMGANINLHIWDAKRNASGDETKDLNDGFDTITAAEVTAGKMSAALGNYVELTEAITNNNAVDTLKAIYRGASDLLQSQKTKMFISRNIYNAYLDDYQTTNGALPYNTEFKKTFLEGSDGLCELVPLSNKKDSDYIHLTTQGNMLVGFNQTGEEEEILIEKHKALKLQFVATMFFGVQFESISPERLFVAKLSA